MAVRRVAQQLTRGQQVVTRVIIRRLSTSGQSKGPEVMGWKEWQHGEPLPTVESLKSNPPFPKGRLSLRDPEFKNVSPIEKVFLRREMLSKTFKIDPNLLNIDNLELLTEFKNTPHLNPGVIAAIDSSLAEKTKASGLSENIIGVDGDPTFACMNYLIGGRRYWLAGTTNENSIAAGNDEMAWRIALCGGFMVRHVDPPLMAAQVFIMPNQAPGAPTIDEIEARLKDPYSQKMLAERITKEVPKVDSLTHKHKGGLTGEFEVVRLGGTSTGRLELRIWMNMAQMMGANVANLAAERARIIIPRDIIPCVPYGGILSNVATRRTVTLECRIHPDLLTTSTYKDGAEIARRIEMLSQDGANSEFRGPTALKGEKNIFDAVMKATGQDDRATSAGIAHQCATQKKGLAPLGPLTTWTYDNWLYGRIKIGAHVSTVGIIKENPTATKLLTAMGIHSESELRILSAASIPPTGLAALRSIATEGNTQHHLGFTPNMHQKKS
jgi:degradative hydroxymethylglutaryl-CoA reductase